MDSVGGGGGGGGDGGGDGGGAAGGGGGPGGWVCDGAGGADLFSTAADSISEVSSRF